MSKMSAGLIDVVILLVCVLNTDNRPTISSVVVEQSVVVVEFKWSRTESIVMSPIELVIVSFALLGDVSTPLVKPSRNF